MAWAGILDSRLVLPLVEELEEVRPIFGYRRLRELHRIRHKLMQAMRGGGGRGKSSYQRLHSQATLKSWALLRGTTCQHTTIVPQDWQQLQQVRCSIWRDNHVGTTEMKSHPTSTGMKHPLVLRGESVQEAGSELDEEQEAKKGKIDNAIAAYHKLCTITYTGHGLCR